MHEGKAGASLVFPARRSLRGLGLFIVSSLVLACFGAALLAMGEPLGAWILGFGVLLGSLLVLQALRPGWHYTVRSEGIGIRRSLRTHTMHREEIASVEAVDGTRVAEILAGPQWAEAKAGPAMDLAGGIRARRELGRIVAFASAPIVLTQTRSGGSLVPRKVGAVVSGRFVLVTTARGALRVLSPRDVDGFVRAWRAPAP